MCNHCSIDRVCLSALTEGPREGPHLCWVDHRHGQASTSQSRGNHCLEAACGLDRYHCWRLIFEQGEEVLDPGTSAFEDETLAGRTNRHIQTIFRDIDTDHHRVHLFPSLRKRASTAAPATVRVRWNDRRGHALPCGLSGPKIFRSLACHRAVTNTRPAGHQVTSDFWPIVAIEGAQMGQKSGSV